MLNLNATKNGNKTEKEIPHMEFFFKYLSVFINTTKKRVNMTGFVSQFEPKIRHARAMFIYMNQTLFGRHFQT